MEEGESEMYPSLINDDEEEDEENMEELEAMLYSQIYYDQSEVAEREFTINDSVRDINDAEKDSSESSSAVDSGYEQSRPNSGLKEQKGMESDDDDEFADDDYHSWNDQRPKCKGDYPAYPGKSRKFNSRKRADWSSSEQASAEEAAKKNEVYICKDRGITKGCGEKFTIQSAYVNHIKIRKLHGNKGICPDLLLKDPSVKPPPSDSKYASAKGSAKQKLVENPFFDSDVSSDSEEEDDGIILLPKEAPKSKETEVIEIDCDSSHSSSNSAVLITDTDTEDERAEDISKDDSIQIVEEVQTIKRKNDITEIQRSLSKKRKTEQYKADFGSDFEDNFETDSSGDDYSQEDAAQTSSITLNLTSTSRNTKDRKGIESIVGCPLSRLRSKSVPDIPSHWTKDMDKFYNRVNEDVLDMDLDDVLKKLPRSSNWSVDRADLYGGGPQRSRYFTNKRCSNCNQIGHFARQCPEPEKDLRCHMCGHVGHQAARCPKKSCLWCGQPGFSFLESCMHCRKLRHVECNTCHYTGHVSRDCPDTWRRFHATCEEGDLVIPKKNVNKPDRDCWCCNCGRKGHPVDQCNRYQFSKYPQTSLKVISYKSSKFEFKDSSSSMSLTPSQAALDDEKSLKKSKKKKKSKTCPNTPDIKIPKSFMSEPASPATGTSSSSFPTTLLVEKAIKKLDKKKDSKQKHSQGLNSEVVRLMNIGKNKKQILAEILSNDLEGDNDYDNNLKGRNKHLKAKRIKTAISSCMSAKKSEARQKEWRENRGFGQGHTQGKSPAKETFVGTRANLIPNDVRAAAKFMKKEVDKYRQGPVNSGFGKRLVKDINQEIFGLKTIQGHGQLKKVERKRLADLILDLRKAF